MWWLLFTWQRNEQPIATTVYIAHIGKQIFVLYNVIVQEFTCFFVSETDNDKNPNLVFQKTIHHVKE